jgi:hypothetical protein
VERYGGDYKVQSFSCWDQFLCLAFAQLTGRESPRDIKACLRSQRAKLYHMGFRGRVSRNTLAHANQTRPWRIFADFARGLIAQARQMYRDEPFTVELDQTVYALDSTTIDLCLSLFPWAQFRRRKSAVKVHTLLDLRGSIPTNVYVTSGAVHDVRILDQLLPEAGPFYLLDRGYLDFARRDGTRQLLAFMRAKSESQAGWEGLLNDLFRRGLRDANLQMAITDGCPGLARALHQRCWVHKMRNILEKVRRRDEPEVKRQAQKIYLAENAAAARRPFGRFRFQWRKHYPAMVSQLERDLPDLLHFYRLPRHLWRKLRTTNVIERCLVEVRSRTRPMVVFTNVESVDRITYAIFSRFKEEWKNHTLNLSTQAA